MRLSIENVRNAQKLSEKVSSRIERAILAGELKADERLPTEGELTKAFGVSRTAVREAMQYLKAQGLIRSIAGSGSYVESYQLSQLGNAIDRFGRLNTEKETFLNLLDLRLLIETETAERFAQNRNPEAIEKLRMLIDAMKVNESDLEVFAQTDMEFHLTIAEGSGNPLFKTFLEPLKAIGVDYGLRTYNSIEILRKTHKEHKAIYEAVEAGDGNGGRQAMSEHIIASRDRYLAIEQS